MTSETINYRPFIHELKTIGDEIIDKKNQGWIRGALTAAKSVVTGAPETRFEEVLGRLRQTLHPSYYPSASSNRFTPQLSQEESVLIAEQINRIYLTETNPFDRHLNLVFLSHNDAIEPLKKMVLNEMASTTKNIPINKMIEGVKKLLEIDSQDEQIKNCLVELFTLKVAEAGQYRFSSNVAVIEEIFSIGRFLVQIDAGLGVTLLRNWLREVTFKDFRQGFGLYQRLFEEPCRSKIPSKALDQMKNELYLFAVFGHYGSPLEEKQYYDKDNLIIGALLGRGRVSNLMGYVFSVQKHLIQETYHSWKNWFTHREANAELAIEAYQFLIREDDPRGFNGLHLLILDTVSGKKHDSKQVEQKVLHALTPQENDSPQSLAISHSTLDNVQVAKRDANLLSLASRTLTFDVKVQSESDSGSTHLAASVSPGGINLTIEEASQNLHHVPKNIKAAEQGIRFLQTLSSEKAQLTLTGLEEELYRQFMQLSKTDDVQSLTDHSQPLALLNPDKKEEIIAVLKQYSLNFDNSYYGTLFMKRDISPDVAIKVYCTIYALSQDAENLNVLYRRASDYESGNGKFAQNPLHASACRQAIININSNSR